MIKTLCIKEQENTKMMSTIRIVLLSCIRVVCYLLQMLHVKTDAELVIYNFKSVLLVMCTRIMFVYISMVGMYIRIVDIQNSFDELTA